MRPLHLAALFLLVPLTSHGQTVRQWVDAAPKADITFTAWDGDLPEANNNSNGFALLPQGFYGYLDLSHLPADAFPIKLRLLYDAPLPGDTAFNTPGVLGQLKDTDPVGSESVVEEITFRTASEASAVPVWNAPLPVQFEPGFQNQEECARAEIQSCNGALLGRLLIGATAAPSIHPRAVLVNAPGANQAFAGIAYSTIAEVKRLVPDSYAYLNVDTIWIDATTASDPALNNVFWQQVLLGGTTVMGHPDDIDKLIKRLGLGPNEPVLLGNLVEAESPEAFTSAQGRISPDSCESFEVKDAANPFAFSVKFGKLMHEQLLRFSEYYLGIFIILQAVVIIAAFLRLRGTRRVWLWLIVPAFALIYTVAGIALARVVVQARSDQRLSQVELRREGWPQSLLLTHFEGISLADKETALHLPSGSRPFISPQTRFRYGNANLFATYSFRHDAWDNALTIQTRPATHVGADVRSFVDSVPPCDPTENGKLVLSRNFSGAWLWDGAHWHNLGPLLAKDPVDWKESPVIHPSSMSGSHFIYNEDDDDFPSVLMPLLSDDCLKAMASAGEGLFLGVETGATDVQLKSGPDERIASRHVVAYQFHLPGGAQ